jgi:hypothetical protein
MARKIESEGHSPIFQFMEPNYLYSCEARFLLLVISKMEDTQNSDLERPQPSSDSACELGRFPSQPLPLLDKLGNIDTEIGHDQFETSRVSETAYSNLPSAGDTTNQTGVKSQSRQYSVVESILEQRGLLASWRDRLRRCSVLGNELSDICLYQTKMEHTNPKQLLQVKMQRTDREIWMFLRLKALYTLGGGPNIWYLASCFGFISAAYATVHLALWSSDFPSVIESLLWKTSTLTCFVCRSIPFT